MITLIPNSWGSSLMEDNDCHNPAGSPAGGEFCSKGDLPGDVQRFLGTRPYAKPALDQFARQHGEGAALAAIRWIAGGQRGSEGAGYGKILLDDLSTAYHADKATRRQARGTQAKTRRVEVAKELSRRGFTVGDTVFDSESGTRGVVGIGRDGQPHVQTAFGTHPFGVRWQKRRDDGRLINGRGQLLEFNKCHEPEGSSAGGQFCSTGGTIKPTLVKRGGLDLRTASKGGRRFLYHPGSGTFVLGGKGLDSTHAEDLSTVRDQLPPGVFYDDFLKGWYNPPGMRGSAAAIQFVPGLRYDTYARHPELADKYVDALEFLQSLGATSDTLIQGAETTPEWEVPLRQIVAPRSRRYRRAA